MREKMALEDRLEVEAWVEQMIAENGYAPISLWDPEATPCGFSFTIGLEASRKMPELMCIGIAPDIAAQLFSLCICAQDNGRVDLSKGPQIVQGLVDGFPVQFRALPAPNLQQANDARPFRQLDIRDMLQLVIPDNNGRFADDPLCDLRVASGQDPDALTRRALN